MFPETKAVWGTEMRGSPRRVKELTPIMTHHHRSILSSLTLLSVQEEAGWCVLLCYAKSTWFLASAPTYSFI